MEEDAESDERQNTKGLRVSRPFQQAKVKERLAVIDKENSPCRYNR